MKKSMLLLIFTTLLSLPSLAQLSIGLSVGYAYNHFDYDPQYMEGFIYKGNHGFVVDLPVNYQFNDWFNLSSGLSFQKKGYQMTWDYINADSLLLQLDRNVRRDDYYLALPILSKFSTSFGQTKLKAFFETGGYAAYWMHSNFSTINTISATSHYCSNEKNYPKEFKDDVDRRFEFGVVGGLGVEFHVCPRWTIYCGTRCYFALTPQQKEYQIKHFPSRNTTITGQVGIMYNFKQKSNEISIY